MNDLRKFPIIAIEIDEQKPLSEKADLMLRLSSDLQCQFEKFSSFKMSQLKISTIPTKLSNWHTLTFADFIKELNKAIKASKGVPLTKKDEFEWMELFEENKKKVVDLKIQIDQTDREIDRMVYALYGLTEEEIAIVEGS